MKINNAKGITLIALIVTIILLIILAVVSINFIFGENGIIDKSVQARFMTHIKSVEEQVLLYKADRDVEELINPNVTYSINDKLPLESKVENTEGFKETLIQEINEYSGNAENLWYIDKDKAKVKQKHDYIIDVATLRIYDEQGEKFGGRYHHTIEKDTKDGEEEKDVIKVDPIIRRDGDIGWFAPDLTGFNKTNTYLEYYDDATVSQIKEVSAEVYLSKGQQNKLDDGYTLDDYTNNKWANVKTKANGLECWWVWIPRYAYQVNSSSQQMEIVFVDLNDQPIGTQEAYNTKNGTSSDFNNFETEYSVHSGFNIKQKDGSIKKLRGIWVAKYTATDNKNREGSSNLYYEPDLTGFDKRYTYIELYDTSTSTFTEEKCVADTDISTVNNDKRWHDYSKKQWANIKTNANGLECWWVWIPRYAYYISGANQEVEIIFIDTNDTPMDKQKYGNTLPSTFTVHPGFNTGNKKQKGIWVAKYTATDNKNREGSSDLYYEPDLTGFDKRYTYIELYDTDTSSFTEEKCVADTDISTVNNDKKWYDYSKKQWANIKTNANGLECWWVWIPRYAYYISDVNQEVEIIFIDTNDTPIDKQKYGNTLPSTFTVHPGFNAGNKKLKGLWIAKYTANNVTDVIGGTAPTGSSNLPQASDTAGQNHTHVANGAGTKERYVTSSTRWCTGYDGTPCSNYGYYIYCSECGVRLRHYWCKNHYNPATKVIINDDNVE